MAFSCRLYIYAVLSTYNVYLVLYLFSSEAKQMICLYVFALSNNISLMFLKIVIEISLSSFRS